MRRDQDFRVKTVRQKSLAVDVERRKLKTKLKNELSTISKVMEVKGQEMMRIRKHVSLTVQGGREVPRQDGVNVSKIERTLQQYDCECESVLAWLRVRVKFN